MASLKADCRKFSPNIFNKSKCQNCFRGKDGHSPEALESNRATRKVSCCGYLFVAPDWDFSLAANRNKRWQRRWFVLFDDGELAYSVDEHPETVPQSVIDMTLVLEVSDAEGVTGNPFALALTCPDKVHFIKGTSKEETKKWFEVLSKFPRNTVCGKYKRNATFPCIKSAPKIEAPVVRRDTVDSFSRIQRTFDPTKDGQPGEVQTIQKSASVPTILRHKTSQVRGDPDGCNPDSFPSPSAFEQSEFLKKGWLVQKQQQGEGWSKHWFVLRNCALASYADPIAEEAGVLDGLLDLRQAANVSPADEAGSGFSFAIQMKDGSQLVLSAVTAKIRAQWVRALSTTTPASPPLARSALSRVKERARSRSTSRLRCCPPTKQDEEGVKERVEEASWSIWLDVAKLEGHQEALMARVEERLQAVQAELDQGASSSQPATDSVVHHLQAQVRAAQAQADNLDLQGARLRQAAAQTERLHASQMALMAARVEDLTAKLLAAERQVRQLRQRIAKLETRRRSSLKGKEALTLSKEYEAKLSELEGKIEGLLGEGTESQDSLLARLHLLDKRVSDAMPKIRLQVTEEEEPSFDELQRRLDLLREWLKASPDEELRWLHDAYEALYRQAHFHEYRRSVLSRRLGRVRLALEGLESLMEQPAFSLCALAERLDHSPPLEEEQQVVGELRGRVRGALSAFKARSVERLCAALHQLAADEKGVANAHFLVHVVAQVAHSFDDHLATCLFPWVSGAGAAQRALAQLSTELRELRMPPGGCGVLLEYARCCVAQLARVVAVAALAEDAAQVADTLDADGRPKGGGVGAGLCGVAEELGVSHRSVSSLLCFKRKWKEQCRSCTELRQEVSYLQGELEESRSVSGALCQQQEIQYNEDKKNMEKELQNAKSNLKKMELHYEERIRQLQLQKELSREDAQKRYAHDLEQLKGLCERGLCALDAAHQRALAELECRHQRELQELQEERQRALAEEAHTTAIAVEAVRRAHSEELKKQVQNFKEEFVLKMNKKLEMEAFRKCYETDLAKMKCEIMSMTEKYSVKCLENATLHEKLEIANHQLKSTTAQVVELLAKNHHLRAAQKQEDTQIP